MPERELTMVDRVDLGGQVEAEPVLWERQEDGWLTVTLDDGVRLTLDPAAVAVVHRVTIPEGHRAAARRLRSSAPASFSRQARG